MLKIKVFTTLLGILFIFSGQIRADVNDLNIVELIAKYQQKVDNAGLDDWQTLAECADALIQNKISSEEAIDWINHSIAIKETAYNHTVKGDYLILTGDLTGGKKEYIKAIFISQQENHYHEIPGIQLKILVAMGIENYNNFHAGLK